MAKVEAQRHEVLRGFDGRGNDVGISCTIEPFKFHLIGEVFLDTDATRNQKLGSIEFFGSRSVCCNGIKVQLGGRCGIKCRDSLDVVRCAPCSHCCKCRGRDDFTRRQKDELDGIGECDEDIFAAGRIGSDWLNACGIDGFRVVERDHHATVAFVDIWGSGKVQAVFRLGIAWFGGGAAWLLERGRSVVF